MLLVPLALSVRLLAHPPTPSSAKKDITVPLVVRSQQAVLLALIILSLEQPVCMTAFVVLSALSPRLKDLQSVKNVAHMPPLEKEMGHVIVWADSEPFRNQIVAVVVCPAIGLPLVNNYYQLVTQIVSLLWNGAANLENSGIFSVSARSMINVHRSVKAVLQLVLPSMVYVIVLGTLP